MNYPLRLVFFCVFLCPLWFPLQVSAQEFAVKPAFPNVKFEQPVYLTYPPDNSNRIFVVERKGKIRFIANETNTTLITDYLDISTKVESGGMEQGLLGLAFHPRYKANGYLYVFYTASNPAREVISRFEISPIDRNRVDLRTEKVLLEVPDSYPNHNGGQLAFGPDGYLYIGLGDGGGAGDPDKNGQNLGTLLGSLLRIDVDRFDKEHVYSIPRDNPFFGQAGKRGEIYAYGLRNPWRFSFDATFGKLWLADVGQDRMEEIDIIEKGGNYGWNVMEGSLCFEPKTDCIKDKLIPPIYEYNHDVGRSITGGYVYRGESFPQLVGAYIYGDFVSGKIWALHKEWQDLTHKELVASKLPIASFGVDQYNEIYICSFDGTIYTLVQLGEKKPAAAAETKNPQ